MDVNLMPDSRVAAGPYTEPCNDNLAFFLPNLEGGGAERAVVALSNALAERGAAVELVLGEVVGPYISEVSSKVSLVDLSVRGKVRLVGRLMSYLRRHRPAVVMSAMDLPNIQLIVAAQLSGFGGRVVISQRGTIAAVYADMDRLRRLIYGIGIYGTYRFADTIISNSYAAAEEAKSLGGVSASRVVTIHNSVDAIWVNRLALESLTDSWFRSGEEMPLIVSVGSLTPLKDRVTLVRAFAIARARQKLRLAIIGEGPERDTIQDLATVLGVSDDVYLPGFDANPFKWMKRAAVVVSSSITEGCPNQILEALSLGVPIVATDCPGDTAVLLEHGRWGRLVPVGDPESMARAILAALNEISPNDGRNRAADFSPHKIVRAYLDALVPAFDGEKVKGLDPN